MSEQIGAYKCVLLCPTAIKCYYAVLDITGGLAAGGLHMSEQIGLYKCKLLCSTAYEQFLNN